MGSLLFALALAMAGCQGEKGPQGDAGPQGEPGQDGAEGPEGPQGPAGADAPIPPAFYNVFAGQPTSSPGAVAALPLNHGTDVVIAEDELQGAPANPKFLANIAITAATADDTGLVTVDFTVMGKDGTTPVTNLTAVSAGIFKLVPPRDDRSYSRWVPYIYRPGRTVNAGYRESTTSTPVHGTLTHNGAGRYTYVFGTDLDTAAFLFPVNGVTLVGYERDLTHRVSIYMGGHSGPTGEADFDFVPDGSAITLTRDIVETATCKKCHGYEFHGHGGDRITVEGCNTCHSPDSAMVNGPEDGGTTESIEMQVMIHRMHAGRELQSAPGADGVFFDDPTTAADESLDNGTYTVGDITATWRSAAFPAVIANCQACHTGSGAQVDNWKNVPSRAACGSCHDLVDFATGANHPAPGGAQADDSACDACHTQNGIVASHGFMTKDIHNVPEFDVSVTTSAPANGQFFVAGESPVITVVLTAKETDATAGYVAGQPIDHTKVVEDPSGEGCTPNADLTACTNAADGLFRNANLYVTGPRAKRIAVLTTAARARVTSATTGPWDLSAGASLRVIVDGGNFIVEQGHVGADIEDVLVPGDFTVTVPAGALGAAATAQNVVDWLNGDAATFEYNEREFHLRDRAIAYVEAGKVAIRTRAVGTYNPSIQIPEAAKSLGGMFTDRAVKVTTASAAQLRKRTTPANDDPKAVFSAANITYTLDPVDDLVPGTYMINVEFADRGRPSNAANYRTPSIAVATFQVKQANVEAPIADSCTSCHWSSSQVGQGVGFVLDPVRHNKPFNAQALDQCAGCHDYASGETSAARTWTLGSGTKPISKRVHSIHNGANLNYPVITVDHEESVVGRQWRITYPMDVRNCESCHSASTSGTWKSTPNRLACMGCHDADAATAHMKLQVWDPTPTAPWSGDEAETCATCH